MLAALAEAGWIAELAALDSTSVRAHRSAHGGKGGAKAQAIGPSRGGQTTKVHILTDVLGRPAVIYLTPGNAGDVTAAPDVLAAVRAACNASWPIEATSPMHCGVSWVPGARSRSS